MPNGTITSAPPAGFDFSLSAMTIMDTGTDPATQLVRLLEFIAQGERSALADLYERTSAKLYGICLRLLGTDAEAEDALQEAYVTVWRNASRYDPSKASAVTWLAVIARNKAIDRLRKRTTATEAIDSAADIPDDSPSAFDLVEQRQDKDRLTGCLEELEEKPRFMIRAAFMDGMTYPELAAREGVPLGTMKSWIRRGLLRLRGCLER